MRAIVNIEESDIGEVRPGLTARFRVDAHPDTVFTGTVTQVRLSPIVNRGVVRYATVIEAPNPGLALTPGMTASVDIEIARRDDVLRLPTLAQRFTPTEETFAALGQDPAAVDALLDEGACDGCVWMIDDGTLTPVEVEVGLSDGSRAELLGGPLDEGAELVWNVSVAGEAVRPPPQLRNRGFSPFGPPRRGRF
jgi:HlyD family secretion protein